MYFHDILSFSINWRWFRIFLWLQARSWKWTTGHHPCKVCFSYLYDYFDIAWFWRNILYITGSVFMMVTILIYFTIHHTDHLFYTTILTLVLTKTCIMPLWPWNRSLHFLILTSVETAGNNFIDLSSIYT